MDTITVIRKMIEENPQSGYGWYLLGMEYLKQDQVSDALQALGEAVKYADAELQRKAVSELAQVAGQRSRGSTNSGQRMGESQESETERKTFDTAVTSSLAEGGDFSGSMESGRGVGRFQVIRGGLAEEVPVVRNEEAELTFADVGGLAELKKQIEMKIVKPFVNPGLFARFKKKAGGGILLYGPPGCGKSFMARATAGECKAKFITVHITDVLDPYIGESEQKVKELFARARSCKPSILFFDEVDALGFNRAKLASHYMRTTIDQILGEIDGIDSSTDKMLIIGATNMPWDVDPAFKRPGRFDQMVFVAPPDEEAREVIFRLKLAGRPLEENMDWKRLARETNLYSGADVENVVELAAARVLEEIMETGVERPISMRDLLEALAGTKPSTIEWLKTVKNYVKYSNQGGLYDDVEKYLERNRKWI